MIKSTIFTLVLSGVSYKIIQNRLNAELDDFINYIYRDDKKEIDIQAITPNAKVYVKSVTLNNSQTYFNLVDVPKHLPLYFAGDIAHRINVPHQKALQIPLSSANKTFMEKYTIVDAQITFYYDMPFSRLFPINKTLVIKDTHYMK
jgi:hypothetical protein